MPRISTVEQKNFEFSGGLNTDASLLNFPENATTDEQNFTLEVNGSRRRRKGLSLESSGEYDTISLDSTDRNVAFFWRSPGGSASTPLAVIKVKNELWFYEADAASLSPSKLVTTYDLHDSASPNSTATDIDDGPVQFAAVSGRLVVVGKYIEPTVITYEFGEFSSTPQVLLMRDFEGEADELDVNDRPSTLSDEHEYNLYNQGWNDNTITTYFTAKSKYPSNADIEYKGKIADPTTNVSTFDSDQLEAQAFGNANAPKGSAILQVFNTEIAKVAADLPVTTTSISDVTSGIITTSGAHGLSVGFAVTIYWRVITFNPDTLKNEVASGSTATEVATVPDATSFTVTSPLVGEGPETTYSRVTSNGFSKPSGVEIVVRPEATAAFGGRAWYAGIDYSRYSSSLFFSQIIEEDSNFAKCYQRNDPTSEHFPDILDTDGGRLVVSDAGSIKNLTPYAGSLLVFADNGVWAISPGEKGYFSPTSYRVEQVNEIGVVSGSSVVKADDSVYYFGTDGIYAVFFDPQARKLVARNLSIGKVNARYEGIASSAKQRVFGFYENSTQQVVWVYPNADGTNSHRYINLLMYSKRFNSFIPWKLADLSTFYVVAGLSLSSQDSFNDNVKLLVHDSANTQVSWYDFNATDFLDFASTEEDAYLIAGLSGGGDYHFPKTASYIHTYFNKTETGFVDDGSGNVVLENASGCTLQSRWDWADSSTSGKFGPGQQVYRFTRNYVPTGAGDTFDDGRPIVFTKNKIRGRGKALMLKFTADEGKDCWLLGWSMLLDIAAGRT